MAEAANKRLGDYEILDILGAGGMGRVYKVRNTITDRVEAMKVLLPDLAGHEELAARFLREIKVLAALNHPNIAALHTAQTIDNQLVMVMEYVQGESLSQRLGAGAIPVALALKYLDQVLDALSYAHRQHVIHRDIKPANMMLTPDGTVKLMDFGIARAQNETNKLTHTGTTLGSLNYMSPEQVKGEATDERSDLYSLGISLYEMVTGKKPFDADSNFSIMAAQVNQAPTPPVELHPEIPGVVNDLILTSIAKAPVKRYQSADAFREAVRHARLSVQDDRTLVQGSYEAAVPGRDATTQVQGSRTATAPAYATKAASATVASKAPGAAAVSSMPAPAPVAAAIPPTAASHRGLYMALGSLVVVVVLIAAGLYLPRNRKASAAGDDSARHMQESTTNSPAAQTTPNPADAKPTEPAPVKEATSAPKKKLASGAGDSQAAADAKAAQAAAAAELDEIEHQIDGLTGRAAAVNSRWIRVARRHRIEAGIDEIEPAKSAGCDRAQRRSPR
jgi:flagellin-like hook-associated protein FlgL